MSQDRGWHSHHIEWLLQGTISVEKTAFCGTIFVEKSFLGLFSSESGKK
jgi:hypothetical protein